MIPYGKHSINTFDVLKVAWQMRTGALTQGSKVEEFEREIAEYVGVKYAVAVSSATAGLHISLLALELQEGTEVITTPISFVASANAIVYSSLKPLFVDINRETLNLDNSLVIDKLKSRTNINAIIPVHFAGLPCDMELIAETARSHNLKVIEDAAHALGGKYSNGMRVGSCAYSDLTVFSFHPVKSITSGEGGMVTTNSEDLYRKLLRLRSHGITKLDDSFQNPILARTSQSKNPWYYEMQELGYNYRLTDFQCVLGISQMRRIETFMARRQALRNQYLQAFSKHPLITPGQALQFGQSANHIFPVRIRFSEIQKSRTEIMSKLMEQGIRTQVHYIPIPLHPFYQKRGYGVTDLPEAMSYYEEALTLPLYPSLRFREQERVIENLIKLTS